MTNNNEVEKKPLMKRAANAYLGNVLKPIKAQSVKDSIQSTRQTYKSLFSRIKTTNNLASANRKDPDIELMEEDFEVLKQKWGFTDNEYEGVKKYYYRHFLGGVIATIILAFYILGHFYVFLSDNSLLIKDSDVSLIMLISTLSFSFVTVFSSFVSYWRYKVLRDKQFIPFVKWINS